MLNFNPEETEENLIAAMNEAAGNVHTAMVTYAARDSDFDGHEIHAGEYLALLDGALLGSYSSEKTLFKELSWAFDELSPEVHHRLLRQRRCRGQRRTKPRRRSSAASRTLRSASSTATSPCITT